jgi:predicted SAM-dependent methyltransferase
MIKLHIGCGKRDFGPGWYNVDGQKFPHVHSNDVWLSWQETNSADLIYASHFLEYYDREKAKMMLEEWHRVLKPGGIIRLAVPDFEVLARLYVTDPQKFPLDSLIGPLYGRMFMNNIPIFHRTCYDFVSIGELLISAGFKNVQRYDWRQTEHAEFDDHSQSYLPKMDKQNGNLISLNVEATK